ncbi:hypothetical protein BD777DRAFT_128118 [Yarrowia lipolytica]|nr:hypothetical protein BD777DRAFT_128118 [Yarrowia lipolytica]
MYDKGGRKMQDGDMPAVLTFCLFRQAQQTSPTNTPHVNSPPQIAFSTKLPTLQLMPTKPTDLPIKH